MAVALRHGRSWRTASAARGPRLADLAAATAIFICWQLISTRPSGPSSPAAQRSGRSRRAHGAADWASSSWGERSGTPSISTWAAIGIVVAVPVASHRVQHHAERGRAVVALFVIVSSRSISSLIWALMLVTILGPMLAGILAHRAALDRLLRKTATSVEEMMGRSQRCATGSGARITAYGIVPQVRRRSPAFPCSVGTSTVAVAFGPAASACRSTRRSPPCLDQGVAYSPDHHRDHRQRMGFDQITARSLMGFGIVRDYQVRPGSPDTVTRERRS